MDLGFYMAAFLGELITGISATVLSVLDKRCGATRATPTTRSCSNLAPFSWVAMSIRSMDVIPAARAASLPYPPVTVTLAPSKPDDGSEPLPRTKSGS